MKILKENIDLDLFFEKARKKTLLIMDYDGTLAPLIKDRMHAYPYPGINERLITLSTHDKIKTIIVSGRSLFTLETFIDKQLHLELWGSHGIERRMSSGEKIEVPIDNNIQEGLKKAINGTIKDYCDIKPYGVALHWRGIDALKKNVIERCALDLWLPLQPYGLEILPFDGGLELRPKSWNKGDVVEILLEKENPETAIAYLGDDATDEDAFAMLGDRGLKVLVRNELRITQADIKLIPPLEVLIFLDRLIGA